MKQSFTKALLGIISATILIASCSTPQIALQGNEWQNSDVLTVKGRQGLLIKQKLSFGSYATEKVDRSWTRESSWTIGAAKQRLDVPQPTNVISYDHINRQQTIRFAAASPSGETADVYAATRVKARELRVGEGNGLGSFSIDLGRLFNKNSNNLYYVQIYLDGARQPWQLVLDNEISQWQPGKYVGYLIGPNGRYYQLKPIRHISGKNGEAKKILMGAIGFEIMNEEGAGRAAVSTIDNGKVYISKTVHPHERFLLENLCAAILLQDQI